MPLALSAGVPPIHPCCGWRLQKIPSEEVRFLLAILFGGEPEEDKDENEDLFGGGPDEDENKNLFGGGPGEDEDAFGGGPEDEDEDKDEEDDVGDDDDYLGA